MRVFLGKKTFTWKWGSKGDNLKKILRKSLGSSCTVQLLLAKNWYYLILSIKMLKIGYKFGFVWLIKKVFRSSQFIPEKVKKNITKISAEFRKKFKKFRLRQKNNFPKQKTCTLFFIIIQFIRRLMFKITEV